LILVVDASVAIKWVLPEVGSDEARRFLPQWDGDRLRIEHLLVAPSLLELEVHNVLAKRRRQNVITDDQFVEADPLVRSQLNIEPVDTHLVDVARTISWFAYQRQQKKAGNRAPILGAFNIYDCIYLALAKRFAATLLTADQEQSTVAELVSIKTLLI
jgi:predicted nucleic acid-binding protein